MLFEKRKFLIIFAVLSFSKIPPGQANFLSSLAQSLTDLGKDVVITAGDIAQGVLTGAKGLTGTLGKILDDSGILLQNVNTAVSTVSQDFSNLTNALGEIGQGLTGVINSINNAQDNIGAAGDQILNTRALILELEFSLQNAKIEALGLWNKTLDDLDDLDPAAYDNLFQVLGVLDTVGDAVETLAQGVALIVNALAQLLTNAVEDEMDQWLDNVGTTLEEKLHAYSFDMLDVMYNSYESLASQYLVQDPTQVEISIYPNRFNLSRKVKLQLTRDGISSSGFNPKLPIVLFVQGLVIPENPSGGSDAIVKAFTAANVTAQTANILEVKYCNVTGTGTSNWPGYLSAFPQYVQDVYNAKFVAGIINNTLVYLSSTTATSILPAKFMLFTPDGYANVHAIGAGIGAHIASIAAQMYTAVLSTKIARLSGCEVAGPLLYDAYPEDRFGPHVANFTDTTNTNRDSFGLPKGINLGQANVDINNAYVQPMCKGNDLYYPCSDMAATLDFAVTIGTKIPAKCQVGNCGIPAIGEQIPIGTAGNFIAVM